MASSGKVNVREQMSTPTYQPHLEDSRAETENISTLPSVHPSTFGNWPSHSRSMSSSFQQPLLGPPSSRTGASNGLDSLNQGRFASLINSSRMNDSAFQSRRFTADAAGADVQSSLNSTPLSNLPNGANMSLFSRPSRIENLQQDQQSLLQEQEYLKLLLRNNQPAERREEESVNSLTSDFSRLTPYNSNTPSPPERHSGIMNGFPQPLSHPTRSNISPTGAATSTVVGLGAAPSMPFQISRVSRAGGQSFSFSGLGSSALSADNEDSYLNLPSLRQDRASNALPSTRASMSAFLGSAHRGGTSIKAESSVSREYLHRGSMPSIDTPLSNLNFNPTVGDPPRQPVYSTEQRSASMTLGQAGSSTINGNPWTSVRQRNERQSMPLNAYNSPNENSNLNKAEISTPSSTINPKSFRSPYSRLINQGMGGPSSSIIPAPVSEEPTRVTFSGLEAFANSASSYYTPMPASNGHSGSVVVGTNLPHLPSPESMINYSQPPLGSYNPYPAESSHESASSPPQEAPIGINAPPFFPTNGPPFQHNPESNRGPSTIRQSPTWQPAGHWGPPVSVAPAGHATTLFNSSPGPNLQPQVHQQVQIQQTPHVHQRHTSQGNSNSAPSQTRSSNSGSNGNSRGASQGTDSQARVIQQRRAANNEETVRLNNIPLDSFAGRIYTTSKDQHGCRYLQRKLDERNPKDVQLIFDETKDHIVELMTDPFGNYLCQKLLEAATDDQRTVLIKNSAADLVRIGFNQHGTRALQKMIEHVSGSNQVEVIIEAFRHRVVDLIQDLNGNHVIQKCLNHLKHEDMQFILDAVGQNCVVVGTHRHGCCVLQRCLDHASEDQKRALVGQITDNAINLVKDPFGNYVAQYILDLNEAKYTNPLCKSFLGRIAELSCQKFSSNVIEKCIRCASPDVRRQMVEEIMKPRGLEILVRDAFGNYVVQTAIEYSDPDLRAELCDTIRPLIPIIRNTSHGRRILQRLQERDQNPQAPAPAQTDEAEQSSSPKA